MISGAISKAYTCQPEPSCGEEEEACGTLRKSWSELHQFAPMSMYTLRGVQSGLRSASGGSSRAYVVGESGVGTQADAIQAKGVWVGELSSRLFSSPLRGAAVWEGARALSCFPCCVGKCREGVVQEIYERGSRGPRASGNCIRMYAGPVSSLKGRRDSATCSQTNSAQYKYSSSELVTL
jgi:hypothetical protein